MQTALRLRTATRALPRSVLYARPCQPNLHLRAFSQTRIAWDKTDEEKRLEEQRKIDEQREKDKKRVYGQHYQDKEGVERPEIATTDESISHSWDEVCVVTGAARGLGNLFARTFVESGCTSIVLMDLKQEDAQQAADDLVKWFVDHGDIEPGAVTAIGLGCDVSNEESVKAGFDTVVKRFGKVDALVASAGIVENYSAFDYPTNRIRLLYDINVHGAFFCAREAARHMIDQNVKGSIVLVSSMSANIVNVPQPQTPYNSSKAAVKHMAASLAVEWAKSGIRVNALSPGYMLTSLTRTILDKNEELKNTWVNLTPMGRMGEPEDLKGAVVYLASDASAFTNGTELRVDGAYTCI
ncbi:hypothetical protein FRC07_005894 [Ceratobasidium sp. 392]|nr:hypothetical protein FRC07_005894 [Ceratobasidium sp. 392]